MIYLKPFKPEDHLLLQKWISTEKELVGFSGRIFKQPINRDQVEDYLLGDRIVFKVEDPSEKAIGMAEISEVNVNVAKLARILIGEKELRGKGIGKELVEKLVDYAFTKLGKSAVILNVYSWNIQAIKCYEKAGFVQTEKPITIIDVEGEIWESIEMKVLQP